MFGVCDSCTAIEILLGFVVCVIGASLWINRHLTYHKKHGLPYIKPWPFVGNLGSVLCGKQNFGEAVAEISNTFPKHKFVCYYEFLMPNLLIRDLDMIRQVLIKDFDHFTDHVDFVTEDTDPLFVRNIFALKGHKWRNMRTTLSPAFTSSKMKAMFVLVSESADQMIQFLLRNLKNGSSTMDVKDLFTRYTNDVIATAAFGLKVDSLEERSNLFYRMAKKATSFSGLLFNMKFMVILISPKLAKLFNWSFVSSDVSSFFTNLVSDTIAAREEQGIIRPDMLHLLMQAKQGTLKEEGSKETIKKSMELTDLDLAAQAFIFLFAGFDTSSTLMCFAAHELAVNQDIQERLRQEIDEIRSTHSTVSYEALHNMKYMDMVVSEALRKYPPVDVTNRVCVKPYILNDEANNISVDVKIGDRISIPIYAIQRDPENYPDPEKFDPERFSEENKANINSITFLPFGAGPRLCIGSRFALMETKLVLFHLLANFHMEVCEKTQVPLKLTKDFTVGAEKGFWVQLTQRLNK